MYRTPKKKRPDISKLPKESLDKTGRPKLNRPHLICLGGGVESIPMLTTLSRDYKLIVMDGDDFSHGKIWAEAMASRGHLFWLSNIYNPQTTVKNVVDFTSALTYRNRSLDIQGVICTATDCPDTQAAVAERLNLPTIGKESAKAGRDKWVQIERLANAGLPIPVSKQIGINATWEELEGFDIIKPVASRGARGVQRLDKDNFRHQVYIAHLESLPNYKRVVAQKFVEGVQLSTESIVYDGEVIFTCFALRNYEYLSRFSPFIIENGCDTPYFISSDQLNAYNDLILKSADALGWNNWTIKGDGL